MIKDIKEINFPAYATLETASATIADMGDRTITSQVKIDGDVVPDFSYDWEVEFKGERYIHPVRTPQGIKDDSSRKAKIDLVFQHWAIYEMKRQYFVEMASTNAGTAIADKYIASLGLNLGDFVAAFNLVLSHYFDGRIIIRLNPDWQYDTEAKFVSISYSYIWDVLQQIHEIYGVRWTLKTNADGVCEILMGYPADEVSHIFEYGFEGGLLRVHRQVQSTDIRNRLLGRGGSKNLPYRYFKDKDPNNPLFAADPDWIPELANITFTELRGKTFRDYVRGWKAKRYDGTPMAEPTEAYLAGYNAEKFDPIEYVEDKESIAKYGVLVGALKNNEEIYPSIQDAPGEVDMIVDAEQVTDDDVDSAVENDSVTTNLESGHQTYRNAPADSIITIETATKRYFSVPEGKVGNLDMSLTVTGKKYYGSYEKTYPVLKTDTIKVTVYDKLTGAEIKSSGVPIVNIPSGDYYYMVKADIETNCDEESMITLNIESVHLYTSTPNTSEGWRSTFDIWVRNIWGSSRNSGETDQQYADRVWLPILGDRLDNEARVVFASGLLSFSSDWEFPIVGYAFDDSKDGSEWRLTLAKSEAELEASGKYIPYEGYNASAGDKFFFIGIDMTHQYVLWGEERVDDYKRDRLPKTARINPSWVIKTDKVRLNQNREGAKLIDSLSAGAQIRLASKQFISGAYESLYVQSMTYNWTADTVLYPDVEVVVSDKVATVKNPVAQIQSNIESIQRQVGSLSNIQQIIRQVCDQIYLRKDGVEDLSKSPTRFLGKVTGEKFRQGQIGGRDWGIYRDENGNTILEADKLVARQGILVSDLVINEATYVGGLQVNSAAAMKVTAVEDTEIGYVCYFDQQQGSVTNKFKVDDVALCQKFDPNDNEVKFYKRRVIEVAESSVTLSKTDANGDGIPTVDDEIIHYGNYTDKNRQFVIIRDIIGGGYEKMLMGLDSVTSEGFEYYFAGKSSDSKARWFVGNTEQYAKYENGQFTIKGNLFVTGSDKPISYITEALGDSAEGLILGSAIIVGYNNEDGIFVPMAGMSGVFDKDNETGGPAAWYGGTLDEAKIVFNMDGSGYLAKGNIKFNEKGEVELSPNIKISGTGNETLDSILTMLAVFNDMFYFADDNTIGTKYNFFSEQENSAGGVGEAIGTSGGGGDVDLTGYATEEWVQSQGYAKATDIPTKVSELENDAQYVSKSQADGTYVIWTDEFVPLKEKVDSIDERVTVLEATGGTGSGDIDLTAYATKTWVEEQVGGKQDTIEDLAAIREGASKGATAAQPADIPTKVSQLTNDRNYITTTAADGKYAAYSDLAAYLKSTDIADWAKAANKPSYDYSEINNTPDLSIYALASALKDYALKNDVYTQQQIADLLKSYVLTNDIAELVGWYESIGVKFVKDADGAIKMDGDFYTTGENSAGGVGENVGTSGGGGLDESQLEDYLTENGYATQSWVTSRGYASSSSVDAKQDKITDLATIRAGAALGATALQGVPDGYVTETELDQKGYATTADLSGKVDKVTGKGLSTNDYTTEDKNKLASLENYDDTEVKNGITANAEAIAEVSNRVIPLEEWYDLVGQHFKYDETNEAWYLDGDFYATGENSAGGAGDELIDIAGLDTRVETLETKVEELQKTSGQNLAIDFQGLDSLIQLSGSITPAELAAVGLTAAAIENMLNGQYNKIVHSGAKRQVWNYTAYEGDGVISIYLMQGDGFDIFNGYHLSYSSTTGYWRIAFGEI